MSYFCIIYYYYFFGTKTVNYRNIFFFNSLKIKILINETQQKHNRKNETLLINVRYCKERRRYAEDLNNRLGNKDEKEMIQRLLIVTNSKFQLNKILICYCIWEKPNRM